MNRKKAIEELLKAKEILGNVEEPTFWLDFVQVALINAIELLKEQEPLVVHKCGFTATCPECNLSWMMWQPDYMRYCPYCGKKVKWDE